MTLVKALHSAGTRLSPGGVVVRVIHYRIGGEWGEGGVFSEHREIVFAGGGVGIKTVCFALEDK